MLNIRILKKGTVVQEERIGVQDPANLVMQRILSIAHFQTSKCSNHRCERVRMIASILLTGCPN